MSTQQLRRKTVTTQTSRVRSGRRFLSLLALTCASILLGACSGGSGGSGGDSTPETQPVIGNPSFSSADIAISWDLPETRTDGSPLAIGEIGGIELLTVNSQTSQERTYNVASGSATSFTISQLAPADYEIYVFVYDSNNVVSEPAQFAIAAEDFPPA